LTRGQICSRHLGKRYAIGEEKSGMKYKVVLQHSDEGVAASVPGLPGCWSQGSSEPEALENIRAAIQEYLAVVEEQTRGAVVREAEVTV
jgi:predicted RNase H-like HicB family nuclease